MPHNNGNWVTDETRSTEILVVGKYPIRKRQYTKVVGIDFNSWSVEWESRCTTAKSLTDTLKKLELRFINKASKTTFSKNDREYIIDPFSAARGDNGYTLESIRRLYSWRPSSESIHRTTVLACDDTYSDDEWVNGSVH